LVSGGRLFLPKIVSVYSNTSNEQSASSAGGINEHFMRAISPKAVATTTATSATMRQRFLNGDFTACPKTLPYAAPRREPETIVLEEGEDAGEICEEGLPKPIQVGNCLFKCQLPSVNAEYSFPDDAAGRRMLKRYLATTNNGLDYNPDVYTEADRTSAAKLPAANN